LSESGVDLGVARVGIGMLLKTEGEDGVFESAGAIEAPLVFGYCLRQIELEGTDGL
jgi:hypothetical protein